MESYQADEKVPYVEFRQHLSDYIGKAKFAGKRIIVTQRGKAVGAFIPLHDLETLKSIENHRDIKSHDEAFARNDFIPWEELRKEILEMHDATSEGLQSIDHQQKDKKATTA